MSGEYLAAVSASGLGCDVVDGEVGLVAVRGPGRQPRQRELARVTGQRGHVPAEFPPVLV